MRKEIVALFVTLYIALIMASSLAAQEQASLEEASETNAKSAQSQIPQLTLEELNTFRDDITQCWIIDESSPTSNVKLTGAMSMKSDGKLEAGSLQLIGAEGGSEEIIETAFQQVRKAILRCQKTGYDLPSEKYDRWRNIEITFDPK